jgi:hypothetical protein
MCRYTYTYSVSKSVMVHCIMVRQCVDILTGIYKRYGTWRHGELMCRYTYTYSVPTGVIVHGAMVSQCVDTLLQALWYMVSR